MDPPPPGNLVQRQGGLEAQRDLSTPPPPHSVKKSVPKIALNQAMHGAEHGYPISRTTVFTILRKFLLMLEEVLVRNLSKIFHHAPTNQKS